MIRKVWNHRRIWEDGDEYLGSAKLVKSRGGAEYFICPYDKEKTYFSRSQMSRGEIIWCKKCKRVGVSYWG